MVFNETHSKKLIFTTIYHNVSNQSQAQNENTHNHRGGANVFGKEWLIIAGVLVRREISMNAIIV